MASIVAAIYNIIQDEENKWLAFNILTPYLKPNIFYCEALKIQEKIQAYWFNWRSRLRKKSNNTWNIVKLWDRIKLKKLQDFNCLLEYNLLSNYEIKFQDNEYIQDF